MSDVKKHSSQIALWKHLKEEGKTTGKTDIVYIDPEVLVIEDGFNIRPIDWDYVRQLSEDYQKGDPIPAITVEILLVDGVPVAFVRDGHHRTHGARLAKLPQVAINVFKGNKEAAIALMFKSGNTRTLTRVQKSVAVRRLRACHMSQDAIAKLLGVSQGEVSLLEKISMLPEAVKEMVEKNIVSATTAIDLHAVHGDGLYDFLQARLAEKQLNSPEPTAAESTQVALIDSESQPAVAKTKRAELTSKDLKPKLPKLAKKTLHSMEDTLLSIGSQLDADRVSALAEGATMQITIDRSTALVMSQLYAELEDMRAQKAAWEAETQINKEQEEKSAEEQIDLLADQQ